MRMESPPSFALPRLSSGNELPPDGVAILDPPLSTKEIFHRNRGKTSQKKEFQPYCGGDSAGVSSVPAGESMVPADESVVASGASVAAGLVTSVVAGGGVVGVGLVAGVTVSVFCSHAARSAAPARMQMYFFIVGKAHCFN
jgi:hypothetical protein